MHSLEVIKAMNSARCDPALAPTIRLAEVKPVAIRHPATVEICYHGEDYCYRCPSCDSLNINEPIDTTGITEGTCPDCGALYSVPQIQVCECETENEEVKS